MGLLTWQRLAFDGTRARANNRRSGTRTPEELRKLKAELAEKFAAAESRAVEEDAQDREVFGVGAPHQLPAELAELKQRQACIDKAVAELDRLEQAGETLPKRLPITDPESRVTPNKDGGFAPNYTPLATVDVPSGLIVAVDVIAMTDEEHHLVAAVEEVQRQFGLESPPPEMLADGLLATGANLEVLEGRGVTLYSPVPVCDASTNPAIRDDPTQPAPAEQWERLPTIVVKPRGGEKRPQLDKSTFVFDTERNCYWCPQGQSLTHRRTTTEPGRGAQIVRARYLAEATVCAACPLRERCLQPLRQAAANQPRSVRSASRAAGQTHGDARSKGQVRAAPPSWRASVRRHQAPVRRAALSAARAGAGPHRMALAGHGVQPHAPDLVDPQPRRTSARTYPSIPHDRLTA